MKKEGPAFPLYRVEGAGKISLRREGDRITGVDLSFIEPPRLLEALVVGRPFAEIPEIVCRICSLCSTVHRVAAAQAVEKWAGIRVSREAELCRELAVIGGLIQSHSLHLACLVLPDRAGVSGLSALAKRHPEELQLGLRLKETGNTLQEVMGGRFIHPVNIGAGGVTALPAVDRLLRLEEALGAVMASAERFRSFFPEGNETSPPEGFHAALEGDKVVVSGEGFFPVELYRENLAESVREGTNGKFAAWRGAPLVTGALSRMVVAGNRSRGEGMRANPTAQAEEIIAALVRAAELVRELLGGGKLPPLAPVVPAAGRGIAAIEAPRGILIHSYSFDSGGRCVGADIITPTAINQLAMEKDLNRVVREMEGASEQEMREALQRTVRDYDPCISCAVH